MTSRKEVVAEILATNKKLQKLTTKKITRKIILNQQLQESTSSFVMLILASFLVGWGSSRIIAIESAPYSLIKMMIEWLIVD